MVQWFRKGFLLLQPLIEKACQNLNIEGTRSGGYSLEEIETFIQMFDSKPSLACQESKNREVKEPIAPIFRRRRRMTIFFITSNKDKLREVQALIPDVQGVDLDLVEIQEEDIIIVLIHLLRA
jgi:hypothetical protein